MNELPENGHVRSGFCCLGMLYSCGHSATCMYDRAWKTAHDRLHAHDHWPFVLFWVAAFVAVIVWRVVPA